MVEIVTKTVLTRSLAFEWPTLCLVVMCYAWYLVCLFILTDVSLLLSVVLLIPCITLHSSLQHETIHILEPRWPVLGFAMVFPAVGLFIPFTRFRDTHLAHHQNELLTDPLDDPESYYLLPEVWVALPRLVQRLFRVNNTLLGRMILGPLVGQALFMASDAKQIWRGDRAVLRGWLAHIPAVAIVIWVVGLSSMPFWAYFIAAYVGLSILKIRTFLEHRAEQRANGRSVIIEDSGPLAFLFLNNNYHAAHHARPSVPWYKLPAYFRANRERFLGQNRGYYYRNYADIFSRYLLTGKEPVAHPIWSLKNRRAR